MSNSPILGQYLWHELLTTDPDAGAGFYATVLGWNKMPYEGDADYTMLANAQGPVGGARVVGKDPLADKAGPNWLTYVGVPDLAAALATVEAKGGRILHPVTQVPGAGGRYAVITDPQGATIGVYEPGASRSGDSAAPVAGPVVWHELTAENPEAALQFYKALFGWEIVSSMPMGGTVGTYYLFGIGKTQMGGAFVRSKDLPPTWPRWLVYLAVPSVTAAAAAVKAAGGKLMNGPNQVPGGNWIVQVTDAHGIPVALHGPREVAATAPKAPANPKAKAALKPKTKAKPAVATAKLKTKVKTKTKTKAKAKAKSKAKGKVAAKSRVKAKAKGRAKTKNAPQAKRKAKTKAKSRASKAPRRGK